MEIAPPQLEELPPTEPRTDRRQQERPPPRRRCPEEGVDLGIVEEPRILELDRLLLDPRHAIAGRVSWPWFLMRLLVANTDYGWYGHLLGLAQRPEGLDEANFWRPSGRAGFAALSLGEPLVFKLKKAHGHAVVGFGLFVAFRRLLVREAWDVFGQANGAASLEETERRIAKYLRLRSGTPIPRGHCIGCVLLAPPVLFPEPLWVRGPGDWSENTVASKGYYAEFGEGRRIWQACLDHAAVLNQAVEFTLPGCSVAAEPTHRYGKGQIIRPRLGQGTFRYALEQAYGRCAVTGEHSLPALDAAHIVPFGEGGQHVVENGLLLRADVHRLYDRGYVTVTPDYRFRVSERLREDFDNGKVYYDHEDQKIWMPGAPFPPPDRAALEQHATTRFLDA